MLMSILGLVGLAAAATLDGAPLDLDGLSASADRVVYGEVRAITASPSEVGIETTVEIRVSETLLGSPAPVVSFTVPGGSLDGVTLTIPGVPRFAAGESVLVYLGAEDQIVGFNQGAFRVHEGVAWRELASSEAPLFFSLEEARRSTR